MRKIHDVLRLHFDLKLPQRQIARSIQLSQSTVNEYLFRFQQSGLSWPLPDGYDDQRLQEKLFGASRAEISAARRPLPDFTRIHHELVTNRHTCLQLLWEEYREAHPDDHYSYTSLWRHYEEWRSRQDLVMRQQHRAGEKLFVDWAGAKVPIHDRQTGEVTMASLYVAVLGASNYTYAEAALSQELEPWIDATGAGTRWSPSDRYAPLITEWFAGRHRPPASGWRRNGGYSGPGIAGTMPGSGLFRVQQGEKSERSVNIEAEHVQPSGNPA